MPSADIVRGIRTRIKKQVLPSTPCRWRKQVNFGLQAYGLRAFQSAASNARMVGLKSHTAIRKKERLFNNTRLAEHVGSVFDSFGLVKP